MEMWVLQERTDFLHNVKWDYENYNSKSWAFSSFEAAKTAMRRRITELASERYRKYQAGIAKGIYLDKLRRGGTEAAERLMRLVNRVLSDENYEAGRAELKSFLDRSGIDADDEDFRKWGWGFSLTDEEEPQLICHSYENYDCHSYEDYDRGCVNPYIYINCFTMHQPDKKYSFHLENYFWYDGDPNHLFLDLEKVTVDEYKEEIAAAELHGLKLANITGATLLSADEVEKYLTPEECKYYDSWWLRDPGRDSDSALICDEEGTGDCPVALACVVRPALLLEELKSTGMKNGDRFVFGGRSFKIISENLAFCESEISSEMIFQSDEAAEDANVYEASDVKKCVDEWFEKAMQQVAR